jgi:hypothetical protein
VFIKLRLKAGKRYKVNKTASNFRAALPDFFGINAKPHHCS